MHVLYKYYIILYYIVLYCIILYYIMLWNIILYYIILYYILLYRSPFIQLTNPYFGTWILQFEANEATIPWQPQGCAVARRLRHVEISPAVSHHRNHTLWIPKVLCYVGWCIVHYLVVSWNRATPSHHPLIFMDFPWNKPSSYWDTSIYGNPHFKSEDRNPAAVHVCAFFSTLFSTFAANTFSAGGVAGTGAAVGAAVAAMAAGGGSVLARADYRWYKNSMDIPKKWIISSILCILLHHSGRIDHHHMSLMMSKIAEQNRPRAYGDDPPQKTFTIRRRGLGVLGLREDSLPSWTGNSSEFIGTHGTLPIARKMGKCRKNHRKMEVYPTW